MKLLKVLLRAALGAALACILTVVVIFLYSYEFPSQTAIWVSLVIACVLGVAAGALWGESAIKWLLNGLMHL